MSASSGLIANWVENKLPWKWVYSPVLKSRTLAPGEEIKFSQHKHPEGMLTHAIVAFDSPQCGIRLKADPDLDTGRTQTINTMILSGGYTPTRTAWASIPPTTPQGIYILKYVSETPWLNFLESYIFNNDTIPHRYISGGYVMAVLTKERPEPADEAILELIKEKQRIGG